jgi:arylsulfatase A-like enzyme
MNNQQKQTNERLAFLLFQHLPKIKRMKIINMRKWIALATAFVLASSLAIAQENSNSAKKTNIIFLFSDDQQENTVAAFGNPHIQTPNIDSLAEAGFSFRQAYCGGSYSAAVCVASRSMLMTGRHWMQIDNTKYWSGLETLPEALTRQGYHTHIVGKWHNGSRTLLRSFQSGSSVFLGGMSNHIEVPLSDIKNGKLTKSQVKKGFSSTMFADAAVDFLSQEHSGPYFLYVAFTAPHGGKAWSYSR